MNANRSAATYVLLAAVALAALVAAVCAPRLAAAPAPAGTSSSFGSDVAVHVAPARAIDVVQEPAAAGDLEQVPCASQAAAVTGTTCFVSAG
jgi:hypothetical protein